MTGVNYKYIFCFEIPRNTHIWFSQKILQSKHARYKNGGRQNVDCWLRSRGDYDADLASQIWKAEFLFERRSSINLIYRNKVFPTGKPCRSLRFRNASSIVVVRGGGHSNFSRWPPSLRGIFLNLSNRIKTRVFCQRPLNDCESTR